MTELKRSLLRSIALVAIVTTGISTLRAQSYTFTTLAADITPAMLGGTPPNGSCAGAGVVPVPIGGSVTVTGSNVNAPTDPVFIANVVWEGFSISTCADVVVSYCGTTPHFLGGLVYLATGCPLTNLVFNPASNIIPNVCGDGNFGVRYPSLPAGTYYYPVLEAPGSSGNYTLVISAAPCAAVPPVNALCGGALPLVSDEACAFTSGTVEHATAAGATGTACGNGDVSDGVWYSFVATSHSHDITVVPSSEFNVHLSLLSGTCGTQTLLACAIGQTFGTSTTLSATGLTVGNTYYLRVADWYAGAPRTSTFDICVVTVSTALCEAAAGNLIPDLANVCYHGSTTSISATPSGTAIIPSGFNVAYLLLSSSGVVLELDGSPSFVAPYVGSFSIRTLVYDPTTFSLSSVLLGQSTIGSLNEQFVQGGGAICASLDITGAGFTVENCCSANAGTLAPVSTSVCWQEPSVSLSAISSGSVLPTGYQQHFLLVRAADDVIVGTSNTPTFSVTSTGDYRMHSIIHDPLEVSLDTIALDTTTLLQLASYFTIGGGENCGAIDLTGATFAVVVCCPGSIGTLVPLDDNLCFQFGGVDLSWNVTGADIPAGHTLLFLVSSGASGTIVDTTSSTSIPVLAVGAYRLHQFIVDTVAHDLSTLLAGGTIASVSGQMVQGGGTVCGQLDAIGVLFGVNDCSPANDDCSSPQYLTVHLLEECSAGLVQGDNTYATQGTAPAPACGNAGSDYADVWYLFNTGNNTAISIVLDPGTMTAWGISVMDACDGTELLCETQPASPVDLDASANTTLLIRIFTDRAVGAPGAFTLCVNGAVTSTICAGGSVSTTDDAGVISVCQDASPDVVDFATTSPAPVNYTYVVTGADSVIVAVLAGNALDFNALPVGFYLVHGISHDGALLGASVGEPLAGITGLGQCMAGSTNVVDVRVEVCSGVVSHVRDQWSLWPNPNDGRFNLLAEAVDGNAFIQVIGPDGRIVHEERVQAQRGNAITLALPGKAASGTYVVRAITAEGVATMRMFVD